MPINFPTSPTNGQVYTVGSRSWTWNSVNATWDATSVTTGPQGTQGTQGLTGTGTQGTQGTQGLLGTGTQGVQGTQGLLGTQGVIGTVGADPTVTILLYGGM